MPVPFLQLGDDQLYNLTLLALPAWAVLAFAPKWERRRELVWYTVVFLSVLYTGLMWNYIRQPGNLRGLFHSMESLEGVRRILGSQEAGLPAWTHYAAWDLFVTNHLVDDNLSSGGPVPLAGMVAIIALNMFFGPVGFMAYLAAKQVVPRVNVQADLGTKRH